MRTVNDKVAGGAVVGMVADEAGELVVAQLADGRVEEERIHLQHLVVGQVASPPPVGGAP